MENQKLTIELPIKVIPSEIYLLIIEGANEIRHYFHKEHTSIIEGNEVKFKNGQYDGWSKGMNDVCGVNLNWEIVCHPKSLENVMKPEDCRFIGTKKGCELFISKYKK